MLFSLCASFYGDVKIDTYNADHGKNNGKVDRLVWCLKVIIDCNIVHERSISKKMNFRK
jgi:hypothetical protein